MVVPARFAVNIPIAIRDIIITGEIFPAIGTLFQAFIPAIIAEMNFLPINLKLLKLFRRSADVTFDRFHDNLHWLVVTTTWRTSAEDRVRLLKFRLLKSLA